VSWGKAWEPRGDITRVNRHDIPRTAAGVDVTVFVGADLGLVVPSALVPELSRLPVPPPLTARHLKRVPAVKAELRVGQLRDQRPPLADHLLSRNPAAGVNRSAHSPPPQGWDEGLVLLLAYTGLRGAKR